MRAWTRPSLGTARSRARARRRSDMQAKLPTTAFEAREEQRRLERLARYNLAAEAKLASSRRHRYYGAELERLVKSLVPPGSRVLEVGINSGAILEAVGGPNSVGINAA